MYIHTIEKALCTLKEIEGCWNITFSEKNNNVYQNYIRNPKKNKQFLIIDMGAYCVLNDITPDMLKIAIKNAKELVSNAKGKEFSDNNEVVVMTKKDYETFELFKNMKAFTEAKKK